MSNEMRKLIAYLEAAEMPHEVWQNPALYGATQICIPSVEDRPSGGNITEGEDGMGLTLQGFGSSFCKLYDVPNAEDAFYDILAWKHAKAGD